MTPELKQYYEELAAKSEVEANQRRAGGGSQVPPSSADVQQQQLSAKLVQQELSMNPWIADSKDLDSQNSWSGISQQILQACSSAIAAPRLLRDDVHSISPISEDMLHRAWQEQLAGGITWASSLSQFDAEAQQFSEPSPDGPFFPRQVFYQGHCGCFCRTHNIPEHVRFFTELVQAFSDLIKSLGGIGSAAKAEILLQFDLTYTNGAIENVYAWLVAPAAQSGIHRPQQSFVLCSAESILRPGFFKLTLKTLPMVQSSRSWAKAGVSSGSLHQLDGESFAHYLMNLQSGNVVEYFPQEVCIRRLRFEDVNLGTVQVIGYDHAFEPIKIKVLGGTAHDLDVVADQEDENSGLARPILDVMDYMEIEDTGDGDMSDSDPASDAAPDLLSMMCEDPEPVRAKAKKPRGRGRSKAELQAQIAKARSTNKYQSIYAVEEIEIKEPAPTNKILAEAVGDDSVVASLDPVSADALTKAFEQCHQHHVSVVDTSCTFDLDPDSLGEVAEGVFFEQEKTPDDDCHKQESKQVGFAADSEQPLDAKHQPEASSARASSSSASCDQNTQEVVLRQSDEKTLKLLHYKEPKFGNLVCELREYHMPHGISTPVGRVNVLVGKDRVSYKAHCTMHKNCQCWAQNTDGRLLDQLVQWLSQGPDLTPIQHDNLSKELRQSLGMKVRQ